MYIYNHIFIDIIIYKYIYIQTHVCVPSISYQLLRHLAKKIWIPSGKQT